MYKTANVGPPAVAPPALDPTRPAKPRSPLAGHLSTDDTASRVRLFSALQRSVGNDRLAGALRPPVIQRHPDAPVFTDNEYGRHVDRISPADAIEWYSNVGAAAWEAAIVAIRAWCEEQFGRDAGSVIAGLTVGLVESGALIGLSLGALAAAGPLGPALGAVLLLAGISASYLQASADFQASHKRGPTWGEWAGVVLRAAGHLTGVAPVVDGVQGLLNGDDGFEAGRQIAHGLATAAALGLAVHKGWALMRGRIRAIVAAAEAPATPAPSATPSPAPAPTTEPLPAPVTGTTPSEVTPPPARPAEPHQSQPQRSPQQQAQAGPGSIPPPRPAEAAPAEGPANPTGPLETPPANTQVTNAEPAAEPVPAKPPMRMFTEDGPLEISCEAHPGGYAVAKASLGPEIGLAEARYTPETGFQVTYLNLFGLPGKVGVAGGRTVSMTSLLLDELWIAVRAREYVPSKLTMTITDRETLAALLEAGGPSWRDTPAGLASALRDTRLFGEILAWLGRLGKNVLANAITVTEAAPPERLTFTMTFPHGGAGR